MYTQKENDTPKIYKKRKNKMVKRPLMAKIRNVIFSKNQGYCNILIY